MFNNISSFCVRLSGAPLFGLSSLPSRDAAISLVLVECSLSLRCQDGVRLSTGFIPQHCPHAGSVCCWWTRWDAACWGAWTWTAVQIDIRKCDIQWPMLAQDAAECTIFMHLLPWTRTHGAKLGHASVNPAKRPSREGPENCLIMHVRHQTWHRPASL